MKRQLLASAVLVLAAGMVLAGCGFSSNGNLTSNSQSKSQNLQPAANVSSNYTPKTRTINMFTAPVWIDEMSTIPAFKDFAPKDFKKGGLNDGNEVFTWQPQMIASCKGDTIKLDIGNPGPDNHMFMLPDFKVDTPIPTFKITPVTFKVTKAGIFDYYCPVGDHARYMHGTLLVYADSSPMCVGA